jgi:hypothetical protein
MVHLGHFLLEPPRDLGLINVTIFKSLPLASRIPSMSFFVPVRVPGDASDSAGIWTTRDLSSVEFSFRVKDEVVGDNTRPSMSSAVTH